MLVPECDPQEIDAFIQKHRKDSAGRVQAKQQTGKKIVRPITAKQSQCASPSKKQFPSKKFDNVRASLQYDSQPKIDFSKLDQHTAAEQILCKQREHTYSLIKPASVRRLSQDRTKSSIDFGSYG
jgi:hypothetical protein